MKGLGQQRNVADRTARGRSGSLCDKDLIDEANNVFLNAVCDYGHDSAEAFAARIFFGEITRRLASRTSFLSVS